MTIGTASITEERLQGIVSGQASGDLIGGPRALATLLLQSLQVNKAFNREDVARRYLDWWDREGFDAGPVAEDVFDLVAQGSTIDRAVCRVDADRKGMTAGCAPTHRNVVLASVPFLNEAALDECVQQETSLTHRHPLAADSAVASARIARQLALGKEWTSTLDGARTGLSGPVISAIERWERTPVDKSGYSPVVLQAALHFIGTSASFREALKRSIAFSGADNYVPVLAGALGGARWGGRP